MRIELINKLLQLFLQLEEYVKSDVFELKIFSAKMKEFTKLYAWCSFQDQVEFHHLYCSQR